MRLLYVSEHRFIRSLDGDLFTTGQMGEKYFQRFFNSFDEILVLGLVENENSTNTHKKVERIYNYSSKLKYHLIDIKNNKPLTKLYGINSIIRELISKLTDYNRVATKAPSLISFITILITNKKKIPNYIELVGCPMDALKNHSMTGQIIAPFFWFMTRIAVNKADFVLYVTNQFLQKKYPTGSKQIACSNVYLDKFDNALLKHRKELIEKLRTDSKIIIGTIGAVDIKYKGQRFVIEALGKLKQKGMINFEYVLVGSGDPTQLRLIAEKNNVVDQIRIIGSLPHSEVFSWLDKITLYVQPSETEGLPRALIEAMSRGVPAFGANSGGIPELLDQDCIFNNSNNRVEEIIEILLSFDKNKMLKQSVRNFEESKKYERNLLSRRREEFIEAFAKSSTS